METALKKFVDDFCYWFQSEAEVGDSRTEITTSSKNSCELMLYVDGERFYVGDYAQPGLSIAYLGEYHDRPMVEVNGVIFEAIGRVVATWVAG